MIRAVATQPHLLTLATDLSLVPRLSLRSSFRAIIPHMTVTFDPQRSYVEILRSPEGGRAWERGYAYLTLALPLWLFMDQASSLVLQWESSFCDGGPGRGFIRLVQADNHYTCRYGSRQSINMETAAVILYFLLEHNYSLVIIIAYNLDIYDVNSCTRNIFQQRQLCARVSTLVPFINIVIISLLKG